jgi:hypothetical protein
MRPLNGLNPGQCLSSFSQAIIPDAVVIISRTVGPGNIIRDILSNGLIPTVILDEVVRQAGLLKENSIAILDGRVAGNTDTDEGKKSWYLVDKYTEQTDIQTASSDEIRSHQESLLIVLHVFQGRELAAISESLGISYKTLCRKYERAIERLEKFFRDEKSYWAFLDS